MSHTVRSQIRALGEVRLDKEAALVELARMRHELGATEETCLMCALSEGRCTPAPVFETQHFAVVLDRFGARSGHLLVVSKRHVEDLSELGTESYLDAQRLAYDASRVLLRALAPKRTFIAALGAPRQVPMSFPHFHLHVIPIYEDDERARPARVFSWSDGVVVYSEEEAEVLRTKLAHLWRSII